MYYKIVNNVDVDKAKLGLVKKVEAAFRAHIQKTLNLELPEFELKWFLPCEKKEYDDALRYQKIFNLIHDLGGPKAPEEFFTDEQNILGLFRKKNALSLRLKPRRIIYVRVDLPPKKVAEVFLHELFHLLQAELHPDSLCHAEIWATEAERLLLNKILEEMR